MPSSSLRKKKPRLFGRIGIPTVTKRQKFVISVLILSFGLFFSEYFLGKSGFLFALFVSIATDVLLFWALRRDLSSSFTVYVFLLPFLYSLAFGLFYFLAPSRLLTRIILTSLYAVGLYSLMLAENIFTVASVRTIALLASARIVTFVITLVSFFFLTTIIFSLHIPIIWTSLLLLLCSIPLLMHALWTITLTNVLRTHGLWLFGLALCLFEVSLILGFWPSSPPVIAIFLTGFFYTIVGPVQVWLDKRLFRGVIWEYIWVALCVLGILLVFTSWEG